LVANFRSCEGFRTPAATNVSTRTTAGVRKPPRDETAGKGTYWAVPRVVMDATDRADAPLDRLMHEVWGTHLARQLLSKFTA